MKRDFSRQSFLPARSEATLASIKVGLIGLCGGGSHIVQQLAHIGVLNYVLVDPDSMDNSNLNRLVGGTYQDARANTPKVNISKRVILGVNPQANVECISDKWQNAQLSLRDCAVIFGCVDSIAEREQIERFCRRFLIHYIDIGMDVLEFENSHRIVGQIVMSSPGWCCLRCMALVTDDNLKQEVQRYGAAGPTPQVVWPNGVLASTAVGLFMQLVCPWHKFSTGFAYLEYNGNDSTVSPSPRAEHAILLECDHYHTSEVGDPLFDLTQLAAA
jgi:molybdopterin/thiamine biosynthesis adenylyltransferase